MIIKFCLYCNKQFIATQNSRKYCSFNCRNKSKIGSVGYWRGKHRNTKTNNKISKTLTGKKRTITEKGMINFVKKISRKNNYRWGGGKTTTKYGYVKIKKYNHPFADKNHYIFQHRIIMENFLIKKFPNSKYLIKIDNNKFLDRKISVHHINGNKSDNRIKNLKCIFNHNHIKIHDPLSYRWGKKTIFNK